MSLAPSLRKGLHAEHAGSLARCKRGGYAGGPKRAAFWRSLGFPNLVRPRAAKARYRLERLKREELGLARTANPFALPEDAQLWASLAREKGPKRRYRADSAALHRKKTPKGY